MKPFTTQVQSNSEGQFLILPPDLGWPAGVEVVLRREGDKITLWLKHPIDGGVLEPTD